ncbi:choline BCCT transporter BetT [Corynebacterium liangguodongii]|uniref:High-affinity choline transporter BetT n=1 Tax=Corynebacterium liangguodongii TaxID=2079535 RepID=A0A2S0WGE3_9CORY|nr:choline BCCT transporter BetT [Corynebacterium liangguodongii]AWB84839.1 high-affinity choline transporter BetT [Corynebacterium liangguodongii]PWB99196.1 high-affinity choline transporter BetT [Corynebacterium liangguodongii]
MNWPVCATTGALVVAFVVFSAVFPEQAERWIFGSMDFIAANLGWYYVLTAGVIVVFVLAVALSRVGETRMGPDHSRPEYRLFTWTAMLFAAGIGVDVMFFSIAGPATNFLTPPDVAPLSEEAARMATIWTMFHYGIPGWAMYALMGVALGLTSYRYHLPLSIRSAIAPLYGSRVKGAAGDAVDVAATLGTMFGIATSLGIGVVFLNYGLTELIGLPHDLGVWAALIVISVAVTCISAVSGVDKGIRRLSELNVWLAIALLVYVLLAGKTATLLNQLVQNIGDFFSRFPGMLLNTFGYTEGLAEYPAAQWQQDWTLFFWAWWIAWAPFVGLFLTRISRGRTLREFILGVLLIPFGFIVLFISIFGNSALGFFRAGNAEFLEEAVAQPESGYFNLLSQYPGSTVLIALAVIVGFLFYVTSADSGSLVMANMTSHASLEDSDGAPWLRIFWAVVTGALTLAMLFINGVYTLQAATVLIGLPFSVVLYLLMASVVKVLRTERKSLESRYRSFSYLIGDRTASQEALSWRRRLSRGMTFPTAKRASEFLLETAAPAVEEVGAELERLGTRATVTRGTAEDTGLPYIDLSVSFPQQEDFKYQLAPVARPMPSYAPRVDAGRDVYYSVEVFTARGTRGRNVMGYTKDQIIADVIDDFERHVAFMDINGSDGPLLADASAPPPTTWWQVGEPVSEQAGTVDPAQQPSEAEKEHSYTAKEWHS